MMRRYILSIDQGTTSSRAIIFDRDGRVMGKGQHEFKQILPQPGFVEHDPFDILSSQLAAIRDAFASSEVGQEEILSIGITNQRETTIVWERASGKPVYNAIVWQCRRTAGICEDIKARGFGDLIKQKTGLIVDAYFSATKLKWIFDNVPDARRRAHNGELMFGTVDTWLIYNLTGGAHLTDYSNASRTMLFDIDRLAWDDTLCSALDIPQSMLPRALPSSGEFGCVRGGIDGLEGLAGVPITGVAGDQQAAMFGQRCFEKGSMKNTYGTGCFLMLNTGERSVRSSNGLLATIAWGLDDKVTYALEGSVFNAGSAIKWLRDELRLIKSPEECDMLAETAGDTAGAYFVPAFTGLGAPYWDMYARGALVGITRGLSRAQLCRAVLESIAYQVCDIANAMRDDSGYNVRSLNVEGGASKSDFLMQFQADMLGCGIRRPESVEATALGAALLSGLASGVYASINEIQCMRRAENVFLPSCSQMRREALYDGWKAAVEMIRTKSER